MKADVILLKSNDENDSTKDRYISLLEQNSDLISTCQQINLLKFDYCDVSSIAKSLANCFQNENVSFSHKCLILTSKQAIESIHLALKHELNESVEKHLCEEDIR